MFGMKYSYLPLYVFRFYIHDVKDKIDNTGGDIQVQIEPQIAMSFGVSPLEFFIDLPVFVGCFDGPVYDVTVVSLHT